MFKVFNNFKIYIEDDYDGMSKKAADIFAEMLNANPSGVYGFPTGGTPVGFYKEVVNLYNAGKVDFSKLTTFNLDEYHPIQKSNDQSYSYFMKDNLFSHVNVNMEKTNILNGETDNTDKECLDFENKIKAVGGLDLQILGIGNNGHIGFNEPCDTFPRYTHYVALAESTYQTNARFFASVDDVPRHSMSMGIGTIMMAKSILLLANGPKKADIVKDMIFGGITPQVPASALQLHRDVTFVFDKEAAAKIIDLI